MENLDMKKVKVVIWLLILGFMALVVLSERGLLPRHPAESAAEPQRVSRNTSPRSLPLVGFPPGLFCLRPDRGLSLRAPPERFRRRKAIKRSRRAADAQREKSNDRAEHGARAAQRRAAAGDRRAAPPSPPSPRRSRRR
ncbi:MAG: hypothetical protein MZV70_29035 [Desulfobacterales bacterium]|nr:hypothetical protein [Desulfobacterales bacterium]